MDESELQPEAAAESERSSLFGGALQSRPFRLLWIGQGTSFLGDQFSFIALPWLVLQLTNDPAALGLVLAVAGIPRAVFMLAGGAAADRFSPRAVMLVSDVVRLLLTAALTVLVLFNTMHMWLLYAFVLLFGVFSGLFVPASGAIMPSLVKRENLQPANALYQATAQLSVFLGPVLAGGIIAYAGSRSLSIGGAESIGTARSGGLEGTAIALAVDALTFLVSIATLLRMGRLLPKDGEGHAEPGSEPAQARSAGVVASVVEGFRYAAKDPFLAGVLIIIAAINFLFVGPLFVGVPFLAKTRFPEGAAAFGLIMSGYGGGNLLGNVLSGALTRVRKSGWLFLLVIASFGVGLIVLGFLSSSWIAFAVLFIMGFGNGFLSIAFITQLQMQTSKELLGRIMSLVMFAGMGLVPVSQALSGGLLRYGAVPLFAVAGSLMVITAAISAGNRHIRTRVF